MSYWTYVSDMLKVESGSRSTPETMYRVQTVLNHLPKITGSEGPVLFYPVLSERSHLVSNEDEFEQRSNLGNWRYGRMFASRTECLIALDGALRDRVFPQTARETVKTLCRLASRLYVQECLVKVRGDTGEEMILNNPRWLLDADVSDWTDKLLWKFDEEGNIV